jgi:hypothetical protein
MAGYSANPLVVKLGIKEHMKVHAPGAPQDYAKLVEPLPQDATISTRFSTDVDLVHVFETRKSELAKTLAAYRAKLKPGVAIWVSWPKRASKVATDITEDEVRRVALPLGFVDVKVCAVTDVWSGLKLVVRKNLR